MRSSDPVPEVDQERLRAAYAAARGRWHQSLLSLFVALGPDMVENVGVFCCLSTLGALLPLKRRTANEDEAKQLPAAVRTRRSKLRSFALGRYHQR